MKNVLQKCLLLALTMLVASLAAFSQQKIVFSKIKHIKTTEYKLASTVTCTYKDGTITACSVPRSFTPQKYEIYLP